MAEVLDTDVLIIGGGAAGGMAALTASDAGAKVAIVVKGYFGKSGCSIFAGSLGVPWTNPSKRKPRSPEDERKSLEVAAKSDYYLFDEAYIRATNRYISEEWLPWMEQLGLYIRRSDDGSIMTSRPPSGAWAPRQGTSGLRIMDILKDQIRLRAGITLIEEAAATSLLIGDEGVAGATVLDYRTGRLVAIRSKSTIIATGHANYMAERSTGTREQCANGIAMAYRVGAELRHLEIQLWHVSDLAFPRAWMRAHVYPEVMPESEESPRLINSEGEVFYEQKSVPTSSPGIYHLQSKRLVEQVKRGKAKFLGGYYSSFAHVSKRYLDRFEDLTMQVPFYRRVARRNWEKDPLECAVSWHMTYGGIKIESSTMRTNVPNLFAAGGVTGHHHIVRVCYDGKVAGINAATLAKGPMSETPAIAEQVTAEEARIKALLRRGSQVTPPKVKAAIREVMSTKMGPVKTEASMLEALKELRGIRAELVPQMSLESDSLNWNYELVDALDVFDMIDVCELTVQASLMRKESRGPFYRDDFPFNDNKNFLKNIVVKRVSDGPAFHFEPIDSTIVPKEDKVDYFASDY